MGINAQPTTPTPSTRPPTTPDHQFEWTCSFDDEDFCDMEQDDKDDFDWTLEDGPTRSKGTGPTEASSGEFYAFIETSRPRYRGDISQ